MEARAPREPAMSDAVTAPLVDPAQPFWGGVPAWALPLAWIVGGLVVGIVLERVLLARLKGWSERSGRGYDGVLVAGVRGVALFACVIAGVYGATRHLGMGAWHGPVSTGLVVLLMFSLTVAVARVGSGMLAHHARRSGGGSAAASSIIATVVSLVAYVLGLLVILDWLGVQITPLLTALGVGGLAVALALQDTLGNLFAGLQLVSSRKINLGDMVRLDNGDEGVVTDLTWRYTTICTPAGNLVIVPNAKLSAAIVTNYSMPAPDLPVSVPVGVAYGSDLERVERIATEVAREVQAGVDGALRGFQPLVRFTGFGDSSVNFNLVLRAASFQDQPLLRHELIKRLHARFHAEGIEIPFPMRTVQIKGATPGPT